MTTELKLHNLIIDEAINKLEPDEVKGLIMKGRCPNPTHLMIGVPIGMHHCPTCGVMVVAGLYHTPYDWIGDWETGYGEPKIPEE